MKVLVVDEDLAVESLVNAMSHRWASDTFELADTLYDAKRMLWSEKYDVIVMDIWMPPDESVVPGSTEESGLISGLLLLRLKEDDSNCVNRLTPCIVFTGLATDEHPRVLQFSKDTPDRFFKKPVQTHELYAALKNAAGGKVDAE